MATVVERSDVPVMCVRVSDDLADIRAAWERLESIVPLQRRKFFGALEEGAAYLACAERKEGDDPDALGLESLVLPGGRYLRERLRGEPPDVYDEIAPTFQMLVEHAEQDETRPSIEFYRRRDEIDLLLPVT
ncbi:MAG TPA: GyrI-like domain-containing protein [Gaiellaceae bacterium]|nr:GyrI-like domain-containing protein [Gaiellaceae bacterium]